MPKSGFRLFVCFLLLSVAGWSQEFRATLNGTVTDIQGAVVPGVKIVATHVDTGSKFNTVSGAEGQYTLPYLNPGRYLITAETAGFKKVEINVVAREEQPPHFETILAGAEK